MVLLGVWLNNSYILLICAILFLGDLGSSLNYNSGIPCFKLVAYLLLHLTVPLRFYLVPSSGSYSFAVSFCLAFCDCDFYSAGCKVIVLAGAVSQLVDEGLSKRLLGFLGS